MRQDVDQIRISDPAREITHPIGESNMQELFNTSSMSIYQILDALTPDIRRDKRAWPSALLELVAVLATDNMDVEKLTPQKSIEKAQDVILVIAHHIGGRMMYLPRESKLIPEIQCLARLRSRDFENHRELFLASDACRNGMGWSYLLIDLVDILAEYYENREGLEPDKAIKKVQAVIVAIARYRSGKAIYITRDDKIRLAIRDQAIFDAFNGKNHLELSLKAKLTTTRIYDIINRKQKTLKSLACLTDSWGLNGRNT